MLFHPGHFSWKANNVGLQRGIVHHDSALASSADKDVSYLLRLLGGPRSRLTCLASLTLPRPCLVNSERWGHTHSGNHIYRCPRTHIHTLLHTIHTHTWFSLLPLSSMPYISLLSRLSPLPCLLLPPTLFIFLFHPSVPDMQCIILQMTDWRTKS